MKKQTAAPLKETFREIYLNNQRDKLIPFLTQLSDEEKKALLPELKKLNREWSSYEILPLLQVALIACCNHTEIRKLQDGFYIRDEDSLITELLDWHCPEWFSVFVNESVEKDFGSINYEILLDWYHKGYLQPSTPLIAKSLFRQSCQTGFNPEADPLTLTKHIWTFFEQETNLMFQENGTDYEGNKTQYWLKALTQYSNNGSIDRNRLLKSILQTVNYPFSKESVAWFCELWETLAPSSCELLPLQVDLLHGLQTDRPRWTRMMLMEIIRLVSEKDFQAEQLLTYLPAVFNKKEKNLLTAALQLVEKVNKIYPEQQDAFNKEIIPVLLIQDEKLQTKAAKLIVKYTKPTTESIRNALTDYQEYMLQSTQEILRPFLQIEVSLSTKAQEKEETKETLPTISMGNRLPEINTWEEFIYFSTQMFASKEAFYPIMFPDYLYRFDKEITAGKAEQLAPIYKMEEQYGVNWNDWSEYSLADNSLGPFLYSYKKYLVNKFPGILSGTSPEERKDLSAGREYLCGGAYFEYPIYDRLYEIIRQIEKQAYYEPVSMPTHYPLWIDPVILVERLQRCQQNNYQPLSSEIQQALMRCCLENTAEAAQKAESLQGEWKHLLLYLFGKEELKEAQIVTSALWITAALTKNNGELPGQFRQETYEVPAQLLPGYQQWEVTPLPNLDKKAKGIVFNPKVRFYCKDEPFFPLVYQYYISYRLVNSNNMQSDDLYRLIVSMPYNHEPLMAWLIEYISVGSIHYTAQERWIRHALTAIRDLRLPCKPMDHLAIGMCFFNKFKEVVQYAAEVWTEGSEAGWINPEELGKTMGKLIQEEWKPLQRFTAILREEMLLNRENASLLIQLIESILTTLKTPVKGVKILLEVYKELLSRTNQQAPIEKFPQWENWTKENSLKKLIKDLT